MLIGMMNNPVVDPLPQIDWAAANGFGFFDLTLEPPLTTPGEIDVAPIRDRLQQRGLKMVCHSSPEIPVQSSLPGIRRAALQEMLLALDATVALGADLLTTHYHRWPRYLNDAEGVTRYVEVFSILLERAEREGVRVALENDPFDPMQLYRLEAIFAKLPDLLWLLDVGHVNIGRNVPSLADYLEALGDRLVHVHLHDNDGGGDDHLPFGSPRGGGMDWPREIGRLKNRGYDGTITLEIHSEDKDYLLVSRDKLLRWWREAG